MPEMTSIPHLLTPPPARSYDSDRLLCSRDKRKETTAVRELWKQSKVKPSTASSRVRTSSAPATLSASSQSLISILRCRVVNGRVQYHALKPTHRVQFPFLEQEINKSVESKRLPYSVPLHVNTAPKMDYPANKMQTYREVFFAPATGVITRVCKSARCDRDPKKERYFVHPEWASEDVGWKRHRHSSTPEHFKYSWM